jgi:hypothetical protein
MRDYLILQTTTKYNFGLVIDELISSSVTLPKGSHQCDVRQEDLQICTSQLYIGSFTNNRHQVSAEAKK